nr:MAG TPA: hypothetical protein [Caudoviricetes sp.]
MNYYSIQSSQDVIEHFGIKGMRWGIHSRHNSVSIARDNYKSAKKQWQKGNKTGHRGDEGFDNAIRNYSNLKMHKAQYKLARDIALNRERNKGPLSKDKLLKYNNTIKNYKEVADKYKNGGKYVNKYHPEYGRSYETYIQVNKSRQSPTEQKIAKKIRNKTLRRDLAAITAVSTLGAAANVALRRR